jgi:TonB family protein
MRRIVVGSALVHVGALALLARAPERERASVAVPAVDIDFAATPSPRAESPANAAPPIERAMPIASAHRIAPSTHLARGLTPVEPRSALPGSVQTHLASPRATLDAASLLANVRTDLASIALPTASQHDLTNIPSPDDRARAATQGYVSSLIADANSSEPARVHAYYGALARRMRETWRPGFYRTPDMVDALMAVPRRMVAYAQRYNARATLFGSTGRPNETDALPPMPTDFEDRSSFSTRTTLTIVEVEQDESGAVRSIRVVRPARVRDFDQAALDAVRAAFPQEQLLPVRGGRRSRWAFEVAASRDAVVPVAGFSFNESNGFFEMHYPGALHVRTRVRPIGSRPLDVPWAPPRASH